MSRNRGNSVSALKRWIAFIKAMSIVTQELFGNVGFIKTDHRNIYLTDMYKQYQRCQEGG